MKWLAGIILALMIFAGYRAVVFFDDAYIGSHGGEQVNFTVEEGDVARDVALRLGLAGVIQDGSAYLLYGKLDGNVSRPKAGDYVVTKGESFKDLAHAFALGPERNEVTVRVIEGWTVNDIADLLLETHDIPKETTEALTGASLNAAPFDEALRKDYAFLADLPKNRSLEGYLFPETYRVWEDQLPDGLVYKQLNEFNRLYGKAEIGPELSPLKSLDDVVILASIVEREVRSDEDRRIVAGIFLNRLKNGMRLQSDATLSYLTGSGRSRSTVDDLQIDSPYNSYRTDGLPPSPVGNPSKSAIDAVLSPIKTDYHFFLTTEDGKVLYAKTFEEHKQNRAAAGY